MLSLLQQYLLKNNLISSNQRVLCAVSGGLDSMVMVDLLLKSKIEIGICHVNHNTRGDESDGDHDFVKVFAFKQEIPFHELTLDPEIKNGADFQQTARILRYEFFKEIALKHNYQLIATAHHSDDDVETFFINLLRGSGLSGLSGIPLTINNVIRPLKFASRKMIETFASENKISFREDSSNESDKYLRNDIRHNIVPALERIKPTARETIIRSISHIASAESVLKSLVFEKYVEEKEGQLYISKSIPQGDDGLTILYTILSGFGFNRHQLSDILDSERVGSSIVSKGWTLVNDQAFYTLIESKSDSSIRLIVNEIGEYTLPDNRVLIVRKSSADNAFWFESIPFPFTVRSKKEGDKFCPSGMNGKSKSIKKFLTDSKVESSQKSKILLVEKENIILGVVGHRTSKEVERSDRKHRGYSIQIKYRSHPNE